MARYDFETRLQQMRCALYGARADVTIRYAVAAAVLLAMTLSADRGLVLTWAAAFALFEIGLAAWVTKAWTGSTRTRYVMALCSYCFAGASFIALPLYLFATDISVGRAFTGGAAVLGLLFCTLGRARRETGLILIDSVLMAVLSGALLIIVDPHMTGWIDRATVLITVLAAAGAYICSLIAGWQQEHDLKQAQMQHAAAQKARALAQFVGGVAHDFNNQLTAILGHLELIERLDTPADRRAAIGAIRKAADRAAATVQQLLAASGRTRLAPADVAMQTFLYDLGDLLSDMLEPGMTVEILPPTEALTAHVDRDMLETCALQLCLNAQDAMQGKGRIRLSIVPRPSQPGGAPQPQVALVVEDDGPGVSPEILPLLVEPFYTTKHASEGRGLGLSAVAGFARQSGGELVLEPSLTGGLRAVLLLPEAPAGPQSQYGADAARAR